MARDHIIQFPFRNGVDGESSHDKGGMQWGPGRERRGPVGRIEDTGPEW